MISSTISLTTVGDEGLYLSVIDAPYLLSGRNCWDYTTRKDCEFWKEPSSGFPVRLSGSESIPLLL